MKHLSDEDRVWMVAFIAGIVTGFLICGLLWLVVLVVTPEWNFSY